MASADEELNPPDLLSSVSIDLNMNSNADQNQDPEDDQAPVLNTKDADLFKKINNLHCPFTWKPEDSLRSYNQDSVEEIMNVDEVFNEPSGFKLRKYVIHLILCYNNFGKRLLEKSLKHLDEMEKMLLTSMKNRSQDVYFTQINEALFHILHSCRVVMLHTTNQKGKAHQVLQKITPYNELNPTNQAGIWAVRANLYVEFGYEGIKAAIQYIGRSTAIDDNNSYWHFMRGMYLGRLRRMESVLAIPSMDEIVSLELAMKLKEDAAFMAFAAEVYAETANRSKKKSQQLLLIANENERRKLAEKNNLLNERAAMLFKQSVSLNKNCAHLLFRCGKGMLKLTPPHQDVRLAYEYLNKGLELCYESSFGNHAMALYYMKHKKDYDMAKKYLIKAVEGKNFGADIDLIRLNFLVNQDPDALLDSLLKLFDRYDDKMKHQKILAEIESYYLFINYNLMEAIDYMNKLLYLIGDHDDIISVFKSGVLRQKLPVSLLEILLSDITDRSSRGNLNAEEQEECRKFMHRLCFQNVTLPKPKNENLRKKVVKEIKANLKDIDVVEAIRSPPRTTERSSRKDYNPAGRNFDKEYAKKYYAEDESSKFQKTVVDEFFEKYEAAVELKSNVVEKTERSNKNRENPSANDGEKSKDDSQFPPLLQQFFNQVKKSPKQDEPFGEETKEIISRLARRLDLNLSISAGAGISKITSRSNNINLGASTSGQQDIFDCPEVYRRRSSRSPRRRSRSRESRRVGKDSSYKRSISRESHRSSKQSYRKRSPGTENCYSTRYRRSTSRDRGSRSTSRDRKRCYKKRSVSRESRISHRSEKTSLRKRSKSRENLKSSRRRSVSKESKYSTKANRKRSTSRESTKDRKSSRRRSVSNESKYSTRIHCHRSASRGREDRKSSESRSISRESKYLVRSSRRKSLSREGSPGKEERRSRREISLSKESRKLSRSRVRSSGKEERRSRREKSLSEESRKRSRSRLRSPGKDENSSRREISLSRDTRKRSRSSESKKSFRDSTNERRSLSRESYKSSRDKRSACKEVKKRPQSRESVRSIKELTKKIRSPSSESCKPSRRKERSLSNESLPTSKSAHSRKERSPLEERHDDHSQIDDFDLKTILMDDKSVHKTERSRSRESRYSSRHSPRLEHRKRSEKSKKYESDDTFSEFDNSDTDYKRNKAKKSHQKDRYEDDSRDYRRNDDRRSSSDETRSIRSRRSPGKENLRSKKNTSRDRRDNYRRKYDDRKYKKHNSSEDSSSDTYSESSCSHEEVCRVRKNPQHRKSSSDEDISSKTD